VRLGSHLRDEGRLLAPELERRQQGQREPEVLGNRGNQILADRQVIADVADALIEDVIHHDGHLGPGVGPLVADLGRRVQRIRGDRDGAESHRRVAGQLELRDVRRHDGDTRAALDAEPGEHRGETLDLVFELAEREPPVEEHERPPVAVRARRASQQLDDGHVLEIEVGRYAFVVMAVPGAVGHAGSDGLSRGR
jgi:hypothetical protein